jgi:CBS domain-containing protein
VGSLPVLNRRKAIVGIITETDMFKLTAGMLRPRPAPAGRGRKSVAAKATGARKPARRATKKA